MKLDLVCFSHLRWNFVYQRPQHLLSRFARDYRVFYVEEPFFNAEEDGYDIHFAEEKVNVVIPRLRGWADGKDVIKRQEHILGQVFSDHRINNYLCWYYTPMALLYSGKLKPLVSVYDCMDELSAFKFAPAILKEMEKKLLDKAEVVFTGGYSLYEAKKGQHPNIYPFPSSIDKGHFGKARRLLTAPADQEKIPHPRLGFFGVLDERFDIELIRKAAEKKPEWQWVFIGPVVKINQSDLPQLPNIHYLGAKHYSELPAYLAGWDIALIPFALNESTKYISPTKTPEYLAAGKPVISTAITDVVHPYADEDLVRIVHDADELVAEAAKILSEPNRNGWLADVDRFLKDNSWDNTFNNMAELVDEALENIQMKTLIPNLKLKANV